MRKPRIIPMFKNHERFLKFISVNQSTTCWEWIGAKGYRDYGMFVIKNKTHGAHRVSFQIFNGPLIEGLVIDHVCKNVSCVNPSHLRQVTKRFNLLDNSISSLAINSRKTHCKYGHEFTEDNTKVTKKGRECFMCRKIYKTYYNKKNRLKLNAQQVALNKKKKGITSE